MFYDKNDKKGALAYRCYLRPRNVVRGVILRRWQIVVGSLICGSF